MYNTFTYIIIYNIVIAKLSLPRVSEKIITMMNIRDKRKYTMPFGSLLPELFYSTSSNKTSAIP